MRVLLLAGLVSIDSGICRIPVAPAGLGYEHGDYDQPHHAKIGAAPCETRFTKRPIKGVMTRRAKVALALGLLVIVEKPTRGHPIRIGRLDGGNRLLSRHSAAKGR